jgi:DNA-binding protein H-NS
LAKQSYASLTKQIASLQAQAEALREEEKRGVVSRIREAIKAYDLTAQDLFARPAKTASAKPAKASGALYSDGNGNSWNGRGPRPRWLREALDSGRTLDEFVGGSRPARGSNGHAKPRKTIKVKPKYKDGAGNTWTGRGMKPRWLTAAIAAGKKLEDFAI